MAQSVGLPRMPDVPSLALGVGEATPLQLTAAYAVFPNGGFAVTPRPIIQVLDSDGYAVLNRAVERKPVISEAIAYQMVSMLADVVDVGTGASARSLGVRFPAAGKTGTTDDFKDAWFVGFSSSLVAGVWVGFDKPATIGPDGYGARYALPIWADFMSKAARVRKPEPFRVPTTVESMRLCRVSHMLPREACPTYTEYFKYARPGPRRRMRRPPRTERRRGHRRDVLEDRKRDRENLRQIISRTFTRTALLAADRSRARGGRAPRRPRARRTPRESGRQQNSWRRTD